jgi:hypothetical protein
VRELSYQRSHIYNGCLYLTGIAGFFFKRVYYILGEQKRSRTASDVCLTGFVFVSHLVLFNSHCIAKNNGPNTFSSDKLCGYLRCRLMRESIPFLFCSRVQGY